MTHINFIAWLSLISFLGCFFLRGQSFNTAGISCWDHRSQVKNIEETSTGCLNLVASLFGLTICRTGKRCFLNVVFLGSVIPGPNPHCVKPPSRYERLVLGAWEPAHYVATLRCARIISSTSHHSFPSIKGYKTNKNQIYYGYKARFRHPVECIQVSPTSRLTT